MKIETILNFVDYIPNKDCIEVFEGILLDYNINDEVDFKPTDTHLGQGFKITEKHDTFIHNPKTITRTYYLEMVYDC